MLVTIISWEAHFSSHPGFLISCLPSLVKFKIQSKVRTILKNAIVFVYSSLYIMFLGKKDIFEINFFLFDARNTIYIL